MTACILHVLVFSSGWQKLTKPGTGCWGSSNVFNTDLPLCPNIGSLMRLCWYPLLIYKIMVNTWPFSCWGGCHTLIIIGMDSCFAYFLHIFLFPCFISFSHSKLKKLKKPHQDLFLGRNYTSFHCFKSHSVGQLLQGSILPFCVNLHCSCFNVMATLEPQGNPRAFSCYTFQTPHPMQTDSETLL